jgi:hypothetical protein
LSKTLLASKWVFEEFFGARVPEEEEEEEEEEEKKRKLCG